MKKVVILLLLNLFVRAAIAQSGMPTVSSPVYYCQDATATALTATTGSVSDTLYWYTTATGGSGSTTAPVPATTTPGTTKYYVSAKSPAGESSRAEIAVYTNPALPLFPIRTADSILCIGESTKLFLGLADTGSLTAPVVDDNKGRGIMFDIVAKKGLNITGFDVHTEIVSGEPFAIYYKTGSINGFESSAGAWTLLGSVILSGSTGVTTIPLPVNVSIPAGQSAAFYLTNTGSANVRYHNGTGTGTAFAEDDNIRILEGVGKSFPFGSTSANRRFEGRVRYDSLNVTWSTSAITDTITVGPLSSASYWARITNTAGCAATDTIPVQVHPLAATPVAPSPVVYCQRAASVPLTAIKGNASDTLLWYTSATGGTGTKTAPSPSTASAGTFYYYVSAKTSNGCEGARDTVEVIVNPAAEAPVGVTPVIYCRYATATALTATAASASDTLLWYTTATGGTGNKTAPVPSTATAGTTFRYVSAKTNLGCEGIRDTIEIRIQAAAATPTVSTPVRYCRGATAAALSATKGTASDTLYWYTTATGGTGSTTAPTPATATTGSTFYYVSGKNTNGCEGLRASIEVIVSTAARPTAPSPVTYCQDATASALTATAGSTTDTLLWYTTATGGTGSKTAPTPSTSVAGTSYYYVSGKTNLGCEGERDTVEVIINPAAGKPLAPSPVGYCQNATAVPLTAIPALDVDTLLWFTSATGGTGSKTAPTPSTTTAGSSFYYVGGKTEAGCQGVRDTVEVIIYPPAATPTAPSPVNYCQGTPASALTATKGSATDTLLWYTSPTGGTGSKTAPVPPTAILEVTHYYVSGKTASGCEGDRARIQVNIMPKPDSVSINALAATIFCPGDSVTLQGRAKVKMVSGRTSFFNGTEKSDGTQRCNCPQGMVAVGYRGSSGDIVDNFKLFCKPLNRYGILTGDVDSTSINGIVSGGTGPAHYFGGSGIMVGAKIVNAAAYWKGYYTSVTGYGQANTYVKAFNNNRFSPLSLTPINGSWSYIRDSGTLYAPDGYAFTGMIAGTGDYAHSVAFEYTPVGAFEYSYSWSTGDTTDKIVVKTAGSYTVKVTNSFGCSTVSDTVKVKLNPAVTPTVSSPVNYCQGAAASALTATKGSATDTLYWYASATATTGSKTAPIPSTTTTGTTSYYVSARTTAGCESARAKIDVVINPPAAVPTVSTPVHLCQGAAATALTATKGSASDTLFWYTTATGGTGSKTAPTPSTATTGTTLHFVSAKSNKGCEGERDTIEVIVNPVPAVPGVSTPVVYCQHATATALTATTGSSSDTLFWYTAATGGTGSKTAPTPSTASAGTSSRYVSAKNTLGCFSNRAKIDITINPKGATPAVTTPVHYCQHATAVPLTATAGSSSDTLFWYTTATGGTGSKTAPTPSTAVPGTTPYYVSAKTNLGCEGDRATINVQVNPPADTPVVSSPVVYCKNDKAFALVATRGAFSDTLLWYTVPSGGTASRTAPIPSTATPGSTLHYVSAISSFGCEGVRDTIEVIVNPLPVVTVNSLSPTGSIRCRNIDSIVLKATAPTAVSYQWYYEDTLQAGSTYDTAHARATGYWYAVVTDAKGCRGKDSLWVQRDTLEDPVLTAPENKICKGGSVLLTCSPGYVVNRYRWYRNGMLLTGIPLTRSITPVSDTGNYRVSMTNAAGCTYLTNKARVDFYPATPKPSLVYTPPVLSIAGGTYRAFQWYRDSKFVPGSTSGTHTVTGNGLYFVEVTDENGCTSRSDTLEIKVPNSIGSQYTDMTLKLYPNPTAGTVIIEAPVKVEVIVTDMAGKAVLSVQDAQTVDLSGFADGTYFFRILDENGALLGTEKIQKLTR